jgi:two-component system sensor histidine kinase PilS (NtrC family)
VPKTIFEKFDVGVLRKIESFSFARLVLLTVVLLTTIFLRQDVLGYATIVQLYGVLSTSFLLTLMHVTFWEDTLKIKHFIPSQLLYDLLLTSYLVYLTGINDSIFLFLYLLNIVFSAIIYQLNGALIVALLSGGIYGLISYVNRDMSTGTAFYELAYDELLFLLTALLCGQLMDELKRQKTLLAAQQADINRLTDLNSRLLNNIPVGVLTVGENGGVENVNETAKALLRLERFPSRDTSYFNLIPSIKGVPERWENLPANRRIKYNFSHVFSDQTVGEFSLQVVPFPGEEKRCILVFQDVSKTLALEYQREMDSRLAATGQLAAGIAHEIRNPLASISGSIETLSSHLKPESEEDQKLISISLREIKRLNKLITDFLEFAKPKEEKIEAVKLADKVREVVEALINQKESRAVNFKVSIPEDLFVKGDSERLKQVFFNLLMNAMEASSGSLNITISAKRESQGISVHVEDNGPGVPPELRKKIFDPFFTTKATGTGLGLSTVAQILKNMQASISLASSNNGAHFELSFPSAGRMTDDVSA